MNPLDPNYAFYYRIMNYSIYMQEGDTLKEYKKLTDVDTAGMLIGLFGGHDELQGYVLRPYQNPLIDTYRIRCSMTFGPSNGTESTWRVDYSPSSYQMFSGRIGVEMPGLSIKQKKQPYVYPPVQEVYYINNIKVTNDNGWTSWNDRTGTTSDKRENTVEMLIDNKAMAFPMRFGVQFNSLYNPSDNDEMPDPKIEICARFYVEGTFEVQNIFFKSSPISVEALWDTFGKNTDEHSSTDENSTTKFLHIGTVDIDEYGEMVYTDRQNLLITIPD